MTYTEAQARGPSVPQLPPQATGYILRCIASCLLDQAAFKRGQAVLMRALRGSAEGLDIEADAYQALGEWVLEEAARREQAAHVETRP